MVPIRVAVIGLGFGRRHVEGFGACRDARVVAICDGDDARLAAVAAEHGIQRTFTDYRHLLTLPGLDAVVVATPVFLHREMVVAALAAGKHVMCEKPLGLDANEARYLLVAAQGTGLTHMTHFGFRFLPAYRAVHRLLERGAVGRPQQVNLRHFVSSQLDPARALGWRHLKSSAGIGSLGDLGVHAFDLIRWWLAPFVRVAAIHAPLVRERSRAVGAGRGPVEVDDTALVIAELADDVAASVHVSRCCAGPPRLEGEIYGSDGSVRFTRQVVCHADAASVTAEVDLEAVGAAAGDSAYDRFVAAVRAGAPGDPSFLDAWTAQLVADAVVRSGDAGGAWQMVA